MNKLSPERRSQIIRALVDGNSIRATCRMTGTAKGTVLKFLADVGDACAEYHDATVRGLTSERIQCDEIWACVYSKAKNVPDEDWGRVRRWRRMDMGRHRRGYQARRLVDGGRSNEPRDLADTSLREQ